MMTTATTESAPPATALNPVTRAPLTSSERRLLDALQYAAGYVAKLADVQDGGAVTHQTVIPASLALQRLRAVLKLYGR